MGLLSPPYLDISPLTHNKQQTWCVSGSRRTHPRLPPSTPLLPGSKRRNFVSWRSLSSFYIRDNVSCSKVEAEDEVEVEDELDIEACELVNGSELVLGEGSDRINALLFSAVKNNNGVGILLLSDIFGFADSYNRDFAYRVACNGYNVLVPDLFRGDPWSKNQPLALIEEWLNKQDPNRVAKDIATSIKWMEDEFKAAGSANKMVLIGFCYGGACILDVLAKDEKSTFGAGVSFYGTRMDLSTAREVKVPVLLITGSKDPYCPVEMVNEVSKVIGNESKVVIFESRGHGFIHRPQSIEDDDDADNAFMIMRIWLSDHLLGMN